MGIELHKQYLALMRAPSLWLDDKLFGMKSFQTNDFPILSPSDFEELNISDRLVFGKRMEEFFKIYLEKSPTYELLQEQVQVKKEKITIGELDFLMSEKESKKNIHLEMVCKFYLYDPTEGANELNRWIGPNRKDRLVYKLDKLKNKQLPLLKKPECENILDGLQWNPNHVKQKVCYKAFLFVPEEIQHKTFEQVNPDCIVGTWLTKDKFDSKSNSSSTFIIPDKKDWYNNPKSGENWVKKERILEDISYDHLIKKSPLIWEKTASHEFKSYFVVWWEFDKMFLGI